MIAYCLDRLGDDPSFLIGGEVPQLGGNARAGSGWLVVEGDESDGTVFALPADIARRHERRPRPPRDVLLGRRARGAFRGVGGGAPDDGRVVWGRDVEPVDFELAVPGRAQPPERRLRAGGARARRLRPRRRRARRSRASAAPAGASRSTARPAACGWSTTTRTIRPSSRRRSRLRERLPTGTARRPLPAAPLLPDDAPRARSWVRPSAARTPLSSRRSTRLGRSPCPGVSGKLVVDRARRGASGDAGRLGTRASPMPPRLAASLARPGGILLTVGAGDVDAAHPASSRTRWADERRTFRSAATRRSEPGGPRAGSRSPTSVDELVDRLSLGGGRGTTRRRRRARLEPARCRRGVPRGGAQACRRPCEGRGRETAGWSAAAGRRSPSACIARGRPSWAASSSSAPSRGRSAGASG